MYCNKVKMNTKKVLFGLLAVFLTPFDVLLLMTVPFAIADDQEAVSAVGAFLFATTVLDIYSFKQVSRARMALKINRFFQADADGLLPIADVAKATGYPVEKFMRRFMNLMGKEDLVRCSIYQADPTYIILDNGSHDIHERFRPVHCKSCGAPNVVRLGFENECKYCKNVIV